MFRPNSLLPLRGVQAEFAEEKEGEFRSFDNNVRPTEKQIIKKLLKIANYTATKKKWK